MDHREHKKWFRIISIASIVILFVVTLFIGFIINQKFYFDTSELAIISAVVSVISVISNSFDIVLYHKSDKDIEMVSKYIHTWQKVCIFKIILYIIFVIGYVIPSIIHPLFFTYEEIMLGVFLLSSSILAQFTMSTKLKFIKEDCTMRCVHGFNINVNRSSGEGNGVYVNDEDQVKVNKNGGKPYPDLPPTYADILNMERCPEYDEVILQITNLPEINEETKIHELNR